MKNTADEVAGITLKEEAAKQFNIVEGEVAVVSVLCLINYQQIALEVIIVSYNLVRPEVRSIGKFIKAQFKCRKSPERLYRLTYIGRRHKCIRLYESKRQYL